MKIDPVKFHTLTKKMIWASLLFLLFYAATAQAWGPRPFMGTVQYDLVVKTENATAISRVWIKKGNMKIITGGEDKDGDPVDNLTLILRDKGIMYSCNPSEGIALKIKINPKEVKPPIFIGPGYKKIGTEKLNGRPCNVYVHKMKGKPGLTTKIWVWKKKNFPIKQVNEFAVSECQKINFGPIPDSVFTLPKGMQITDVSSSK